MVKTAIALIFLFIGLITGFLIGKQANSEKTETSFQEIRLGENKLTNPLLECDVNGSVGESEYKPSKLAISSLINEEVNNKNITHASVYYRDLNNGPWFGINELENFSPASLLKLPVLIAYLKQAETDPDILKKKFIYKKILAPVEQSFVPENPFLENKEYSVEELLEQMIVYSDNNALFILEKNIKNEAIDNITKDLGIETATDTTPEDYMSVKSYASLFRVLFNASYLNKEMSEKALGILAKVVFTKGIVSGLPGGFPVAHKFGERELQNGVKQLHDCGIIYLPKHPYLLCVMTRGADYNRLSVIIGRISKKIYEDLVARYK